MITAQPSGLDGVSPRSTGGPPFRGRTSPQNKPLGPPAPPSAHGARHAWRNVATYPAGHVGRGRTRPRHGHACGHRGCGQLVDALRRHYLTPQLRRNLTGWGAAHHREGVLRAAGTPTGWRVEYNDSGTGHC